MRGKFKPIMSLCHFVSLFTLVALLLVFPVRICDNLSLHKNGNNDALFLTPYIESGRIEEAQRLATVTPMLKNVKSYAGYLTVNKTSNSHSFFWLIKSQQGKWKERPLVVYLHGGRAESSLLALFRDIGPFFVDQNQTLRRRRYSWNRKYNLVFIDNPVGAGYSFTETDSGYAKDIFDVAQNLYEALAQLSKLFPVLKKLVIVGHSYAAKYAIAIAHKIYETNKVSHVKLDIERLALLSTTSWANAVSMAKYGSNLYNVGLIDWNQRRGFIQQEEELGAVIRAGDVNATVSQLAKMYDEIKELTGLHDALDFVSDGKVGKDLKARTLWYLNQPEVRRALHVGHRSLRNGTEAWTRMRDHVASVKSLIEELLAAELFPIVFVNGQLDIAAAYSSSLEFYDSLRWPRAKDYHEAKRCQFRVGNQVAGYYKTAGTFTEVLLRNAGHLFPVTQPKWSFRLIHGFISNSTFFQCV